MNTRPVSSLGYQTAADVLESWLDPTDEDDEKTVEKAKKSKLGTARARRGAAHIKKYPVGAKVRKISLKYLKEAGSRGNIMKQAPPWSKDVYSVTERRGGDDNMPQYRLDNDKTWILHNELQQVFDGIVLKPPPSVFESPDYQIVKEVPGKVYYRGFPLSENASAVVSSQPDDQPDNPIPAVQLPLPPQPVQQPLPTKRVRKKTQLYNPTTGSGII